MKSSDDSRLSKIIDGCLIVGGTLGSAVSLTQGMYLTATGSGIVAGNSAHNLYKRFKNKDIENNDHYGNLIGLGLLAVEPTLNLITYQCLDNLMVFLGGTLPGATYGGALLDKHDQKNDIYAEKES